MSVLRMTSVLPGMNKNSCKIRELEDKDMPRPERMNKKTVASISFTSRAKRC